MISGPKAGDEDARLHFVYDAWNRLTEVRADDSGEPGDLVAAYEYDGLNRRIQKTVGSGQSAVGSDYYYNENWQVVEEVVSSQQSAVSRTEYIWDVRYIDSPVLRDVDSDADGDVDQRLYYLNDANMNVTALVGTDGAVKERYAYDGYGRPAVLDAAFNAQASTLYGNNLFLDDLAVFGQLIACCI